MLSTQIDAGMVDELVNSASCSGLVELSLPRGVRHGDPDSLVKCVKCFSKLLKCVIRCLMPSSRRRQIAYQGRSLHFCFRLFPGKANCANIGIVEPNLVTRNTLHLGSLLWRTTTYSKTRMY